MTAPRVGITGLGLVTPLGTDIDTVWKSVLSGTSATAPIQGFDASGYPSQVAAEIRDFDPRRWVAGKTLRRNGRATHFALAAAAIALEDAGWIGGSLDPGDAAVMMGTGYGSMPSVEDAYHTYYTEGWRKNPFLCVPMCMPNAPGSAIALEFHLRGPSYTLAAACASGAVAVAEGLRLLRSGLVRRALCGGVDACILPGVFAAWCLLGVLSRRNHDPQGACAPFSADRDGLVLGDGAAVLCLERLEDAEARGAPVYAELAGFGSNCDGETLTAPSLAGEVEAIRLALLDSGLAPGQIGYINAHGSGTRLGDRVETQAIQAALGEQARRVAVSSTKSMIGHTMGASGALEVAITALALRDQVLPPTINLRQKDPDCGLDYVPVQRPASFDAALSNSFAFGGTNVILALKRAATD